MGNFVEWYDFVIYAFLATQIARNFFPQSSPTAGLLSTLAVLGAGFVLRPIGATVCGYLGDRFGRRNVLSGVIISMSTATFLMGVIPSYEVVGVWAPILLLVLRLIQSFSAGGEFGGVTSFLFEHARKDRRGLIGSIQPASMQVAVATSVGLSLAVTAWMSPEMLNTWGWRILFFLALPMGLVGLYIRLGVEETPEFLNAKENAGPDDAEGLSKNPVKEALTQHWKQIIVAALACACWTAGGYVTLLYLPTYFGSVLERPSREGLLISFIGLSVYVVCIPIAGRLSDSFPRWKVMLTGAVATAVVAIPAFHMLSTGSLALGVLAAVLFAITMSLCSGPTTAFLSELVPAKVRNSSNAISYAIANTVFAGFAPFIVTWMIVQSGSVISPAYYLIGAQLLTVLGLVFNTWLVRRPERVPSTLVAADAHD
ncbi:MAG: hypothetical protein ABS81_06005 [Pseudonocardia sp. SCN 72-86]|nr:MAG: hypothetical protein ABS81_06005 [Pseudonocardia sp. SCN 72-86]